MKIELEATIPTQQYGNIKPRVILGIEDEKNEKENATKKFIEYIRFIEQEWNKPKEADPLVPTKEALCKKIMAGHFTTPEMDELEELINKLDK